ncbi:MAG: hypothetical protein JSV84_16915 [Gemmatimonadota bacterium]|nr:MAG: hypothetical protein JSV84_16915 [Gemmatimonadota bacterium]
MFELKRVCRGVSVWLWGAVFALIPSTGSRAGFLLESDVPEFRVLAADNGGIEISVEIPEPVIEDVVGEGHIYQKVRISRTGWRTEAGRPELPVLARLVAVPRGVAVDVEVRSGDYSTASDIRVWPSRGEELERKGKHTFTLDEEIYTRDSFYPESVVEVGSPIRIRDLEVVPLIVHPVQYNPLREELRVYRNITVVLRPLGNGGSRRHHDSPGTSEAFEKLFRSSILNYDSSSADEIERGGYLIITPDYYFEALQPLAEWKRQKGYHTEVVMLSQIGSFQATGSLPTNEHIRSYIQDYYTRSSVPLEYVILVGDDDMPTFLYYDEMEGMLFPSWPWDATDHPYSLLEGDDYFPDVFVGRLSVSSLKEVRTVVNKIVSYEREPYMGQTDWYKRALMVCNFEGNASSRTTKLWVRDKLFDNGFVQVDTSFTYSVSECDVGFISTVLNSGVSFVNYRGIAMWGGWASYVDLYNIYRLQNGFMLPVITDMTCTQASFYLFDCVAEGWLRAGTPLNPKGGIAIVGPTASNTKVYFNNVLDGGFYSGVFDDSLFTVGQALARAKTELYNQYPLNRGPGHAWNSVECYFYMYTLIGDPGLDMWTDIPRLLTVEHPSVIESGVNVLDLKVKDSMNRPVSDAYVSLTRGGEILSGGFTGGDGRIALPQSVEIGDSVRITVTKHNFKPYQTVLGGEGAEVVVSIADYRIDDDSSDGSSGDGDGRLNPGETVELSLSLKNSGIGETAFSVSATFAIDDRYATVLEEFVQFGAISPGDSVWGQGDYVFSVRHDCPDGHELVLSLEATDSNGNEWNDFLRIGVAAPAFSLEEVVIEDAHQVLPNGRLDPGETAHLVVTIANEGRKPGENVEATLRTIDSNITLVDSTAFWGNMPLGTEATNSDDPFLISADLMTFSGHRAQFVLVLESNVGMRDEIVLSISIGNISSSDPVGPDAYGYFAFDSNDWSYFEKPLYEWFEIDPSLGGSGTLFNFVDEPGLDSTFYDHPQGDTEVLPLPFTFRYYGQSYDTISVCSNGWLSMGSTWMTNFRNWGIPAVLNPPCLIAPFWDDLYVGDGSVTYYYDAPKHRFCVEWSGVHNDYDDALETFQVFLFDPAYYRSDTGDGEILFQYHTVNNSDYAWNFATVGIASPDKQSGLGYTYAGQYAPGAMELHNGLAIKFKTGRHRPESPSLGYYGCHLDDDAYGRSSGDGDGIVDAGERIELALRVINHGQENAEGITALLRSADLKVSVQDSLKSFPNITPGDTARSEGPFVIEIATVCEDGHTIDFVLETRTGGSFCSLTNFDIEVAAPVIVHETFTLNVIEGDEDDRIESGETWEFYVNLQNIGGDQATGVSAVLTIDDAYVTLLNDTVSFLNIPPQAACENSDDPFLFRIDDETPYHNRSFDLSVSSNSNHYSTVLSFEIVIERADILLVDDDGGDGCEVYYLDALNRQGRSYEVYERSVQGAPGVSMLRDYWAIIWFTGSERESTLTVFDQECLEAYLDEGGNLFVSGQNIASDLSGSSFLLEYMHAELVADSSGVIWVEGVAGNPITGDLGLLSLATGNYGADNQDSPDEIEPLGGANPLLTYYGTENPAALRYRNGYGLVYYAVGFESLIEFYDVANAYAMRSEMLGRILDWFEVEPRIGDVNEDGAVNILDIVRMINIILAIEGDPTEYQVWASDCTGDGQVNILDVVGIVNVILGIRR